MCLFFELSDDAISRVEMHWSHLRDGFLWIVSFKIFAILSLEKLGMEMILYKYVNLMTSTYEWKACSLLAHFVVDFTQPCLELTLLWDLSISNIRNPSQIQDFADIEFQFYYLTLVSPGFLYWLQICKRCRKDLKSSVLLKKRNLSLRICNKKLFHLLLE